MTVEELLARISSRELTYWLALERVDPLPDFWLAHARLMAHVTNLWSQKGGAKVEDYLIVKPGGGAGDVQSAEEGKAIMAAFAAAQERAAKRG